MKAPSLDASLSWLASSGDHRWLVRGLRGFEKECLRVAADGSLASPAAMTVLHNGVLVQNHAVLSGPTVFIGEPEYEAHGEREPIMLQDHGNPVSFRNIWVRELDR